MKPYRLLFLLLGIAFEVSALKIECTPGMLKYNIENPESVADLELTGSADASDLFFVARSMPALQVLDMGSLTIEAYTGQPLEGSGHYDAATIPAAAFAASTLKSVVLPSKCTVGDFAFAGAAIEKLALPACTAVGTAAFARCVSLAQVTCEGDVSLQRSAFCNCTNLKAVKGSEYITLIPDKAFENCSSLSSFSFSALLQEVGEASFAHTSVGEAKLAGCSALTRIGNWAFAHNSSLTAVSLPAGIELGRGVFFDCSALVEFEVDGSMAALPDFALKGTAVPEVNLPEGTEAIGRYALMDASEISKLTLPSTLASIGDGAMVGMAALDSIDASALRSVPELGAEVWADVDQPGVKLIVDAGMKSQFENTPQWQEFDIYEPTTVTGNVDISLSSLRAAFSGMLLLVESSVQNIENISIYDISGHLLLGIDAAAGTARIDADTSPFAGPVFIVKCRLTDGSVATVKLLR